MHAMQEHSVSHSHAPDACTRAIQAIPPVLTLFHPACYSQELDEPAARQSGPHHADPAAALAVLDEPAARQSDPTVLTLQLRQLTKEAPGNQAHMIGECH
eukprot:1109630-Pelagomonas_calceolata.AAC.7